jgi:hypothetical protein
LDIFTYKNTISISQEKREYYLGLLKFKIKNPGNYFFFTQESWELKMLSKHFLKIFIPWKVLPGNVIPRIDFLNFETNTPLLWLKKCCKIVIYHFFSSKFEICL